MSADVTAPRERKDVVDGRVVRSLVAGPPAADRHVVVLPGMGALGYLVPLARTLAAAGVRCSLLDLPGFGASGPRPADPTVGDVARCAASWLRTQPPAAAVLFGHSTGAQAALRAAVTVQDDGLLSGLVLAGPTVAPGQRSLARLLALAPLAYRRESPRELVVTPDYLRARAAAVTLLRSAVRDRPEQRLGALRLPVVLAAGRADAYVPDEWLAELASAASGAASVRTVRLPGSHNGPAPHPQAYADLALSLLAA